LLRIDTLVLNKLCKIMSVLTDSGSFLYFPRLSLMKLRPSYTSMIYIQYTEQNISMVIDLLSRRYQTNLIWLY